MDGPDGSHAPIPPPLACRGVKPGEGQSFNPVTGGRWVNSGPSVIIWMQAGMTLLSL